MPRAPPWPRTASDKRHDGVGISRGQIHLAPTDRRCENSAGRIGAQEEGGLLADEKDANHVSGMADPRSAIPPLGLRYRKIRADELPAVR